MTFKDWCRPVFALVMGGMAGIVLSQHGVADEEAPAKSIRWRTSYAEAAVEAGQKNKPILIKITATWCGACRQMQHLTFSDKGVVKYVESAYVPLVIDADAHSDLVSGFRVEAYPTTLVISPELKILKRFTGFQSASALLPGLEKVIQEQYAGNEVIQPVSATQPANTSPFAFEGFCLVSIMDDQKLRRGDAEITATYRDQEICFQSEGHRKKFLANPEKYWPVANGKCLVSERDQQQEAVGDPRVGVTYKGRLWLFSDRESQRRFIRSPRKYMVNGM